MTLKSRIYYDQTPNHGQNLEQGISMRDKHYRALVTDMENLQAEIDALALTGTGDVVGPAVAVNNDIALFDGVTGKLIKDSGVSISDLMDTATYDPAGSAAQVTVTAINVTVVQLGVLIAGADLIPGQTYLITNAAVAQGTCQIMLKAFDTTRLETTGYGTFQNAAMGGAINCEMDYDVGTDFISRVTRPYDAANTSLPMTVTDAGNGAIAAFPFDDTISFQDSYLENPVINNIGGTILSTRLGNGCIVDLQNSSTISSVTAGTGNGFYFGGTAASGINGGIIGDNNSITLVDAVSLQQVFIGSGKIIDTTGFLTAYIPPAGCVLIGNKSTFPVDVTQNTNVVEALGVIDMSTFAFCGIIYLNDPGSGTLNTISNAPTDHEFEFRASLMGTTDLLIRHNTGNIMLSGALDTTLNILTEDWISFRASTLNVGDVVQVDSVIYS